MSNNRFIDTHTVIQKFHRIHGDLYDYSETEYISSKHKLKIICNVHGAFWQLPSDHKNGRGCPTCNGNKEKISQEEFKERVYNAHGTFYDISKAVYKNKKTPVKVICPFHGEFWKSPRELWLGRGCRQCGYKKALQKRIENGHASDPKRKDEFIRYRDKVRELSEINFRKYYYDINPLNLPRGPFYHLDHIISILDGFLMHKTEEEISHPSNLRIIDARSNRQKGSQSINEPTKINPITLKTKKSKRHAINSYIIKDIHLNTEFTVHSLSQWCKDNNLSVSSARWASTYQSTPWKKRYIIRKL
jgi:protein-arginine kinase activator protein McsA